MWLELYDAIGRPLKRLTGEKKRLYPDTSVRFQIDLGGVLIREGGWDLGFIRPRTPSTKGEGVRASYPKKGVGGYNGRRRENTFAGKECSASECSLGISRVQSAEQPRQRA